MHHEQDRRKPMPGGYTFRQAKQAGLNWRGYTWHNLPNGTWTARLDFKIWSFDRNGRRLDCFFSDLATGRKFALSVNQRPPGDRLASRYGPGRSTVDFGSRAVHEGTFALTTRCSASGKIIWMNATMVEASEAGDAGPAATAAE